jgi:hypothetical protein
MIAATLLSLCLMGACQPQPPDPAAVETEQAADELAQDIELLGTLNRLDLQPAQLSPLSALALRAQEAATKLQPQRQAALLQLIPRLREKRTLLMQDQDVPDQLDTQIRQAHARLEQVDEQIATAHAALAPDARKVLTADQIAIIAGTDEARSQTEELLDWIRELPQGDFAEEAQANANELAVPEAKLSAEEIMKVFNEVRKLTAADFQAKGGQYVTKLLPLYAPPPRAVDDAIVQFVKSPRLPVLLQERGAK